jgi:cholesterol 7-dehydrogenase
MFALGCAGLVLAGSLYYLDTQRKGPALPLSMPCVDICLFLALASVSLLAYPASPLLGLLVLLGALGIVYASSGTCVWLSLAHQSSHSSPDSQRTTSLLHRRSVGRRLPPPYPDAWYAVAFSEELKPGAVLDATVCGRALVIFRAAAPPHGVSVLSAYCKHMGAHLAHGGAALTPSGCIRCPFHGWCYDAQGRAVATGSGDAPPPGSDLKAYPCLERNGVVSVWMAACEHREEGAASTPPPASPWFEPPVLPELAIGSSGAFVYHGMTENIVHAIIYELPENGADIGHLSALHSAFVVASLRPLLSHAWKGHWRPHESEPHLARLTIDQTMVLLGVPLPGAVHVEILQCGPSQVYLSFDLPLLGKVVITETVTPVEPCLQRVLHACHAARSVPRLVAKTLLASVIRAYEQDVAVWAHKRYEATPALTASESSVKAYRGWVKQFHAHPKALTFAEARRAQMKIDLGLAEESELQW